MDQAISIMGEKGLAKLVHFKPVRPFGVLPLLLPHSRLLTRQAWRRTGQHEHCLIPSQYQHVTKIVYLGLSGTTAHVRSQHLIPCTISV